MKTSTLSAVFFAAFISVSAHSQILTNYGDATYPGYGYGGSWDGSSGRAINNGSNGRWAAQTFIAPTTGSTTLFAYNFQLNISGGATASFTTAIYNWSGNSIGTLVADTSASFNGLSSYDFSPLGANTVNNPGFGATLVAGQLYAIVVNRTDLGTTGTVQMGIDVTDQNNIDDPLNPISGSYTDGKAFRSSNGTTFSALSGGNNDFAFWVSFDENFLSPAVPEPAVNGAIIGALFVTGLIAWRRYGKKGAVAAQIAA